MDGSHGDRTARVLSIVGALLGVAGLLLILVAWNGTAHTALVFEQIPYLVSGGQLGTALVVLGGFLYFSSWLTVLVHDQRETHRLLAELLQASTSAETATPALRLVATSRGDMVHLETCRVVAGRTDLRPGDLLTMRPCGICTPDAPVSAA
jgi:hypothetical protein